MTMLLLSRKKFVQ